MKGKAMGRKPKSDGGEVKDPRRDPGCPDCGGTGVKLVMPFLSGRIERRVCSCRPSKTK